LTANPNLLTNTPKNKTTIKYITDYNSDINCLNTIDKLGDFDDLIKQIKL
jgi:hypothetical protein